MLFKRKKAPDVVDLTDMQRRGLLKESKHETEPETPDVLDFSTTTTPSSQATAPTEPADFLSNLAGASEQPTQTHTPSVSESLRNAREEHRTQQQNHQLKLQIEDNEYRIKQLTERITELEHKLRDKGL